MTCLIRFVFPECRCWLSGVCFSCSVAGIFFLVVQAAGLRYRICLYMASSISTLFAMYTMPGPAAPGARIAVCQARCTSPTHGTYILQLVQRFTSYANCCGTPCLFLAFSRGGVNSSRGLLSCAVSYSLPHVPYSRLSRQQHSMMSSRDGSRRTMGCDGNKHFVKRLL